ncbi:hypothetical protein CKM354_001148600 [Cercospora kikuchii]|uniref:ribonuclease H n=1 Tax=Cercospora kikuchii TaxID=84275 RepID=A0A9P3CX38_9PEZI|nr:uncharacterized protein CKM354_001148600 [Cercospora kikuchii]GIZ48425.1 hypothetical protein CKM354_001148600 [Cercospora kikuchii]
MPFIMIWYVDGGCRNNGAIDAKGAAAAIRSTRVGNISYTLQLPYNGIPHTNQRAELLAIIIALKESLNLYQTLDFAPFLDVTIHCDSRYAIGCMTQWIQRWSQNGWINSKGRAVVNQDLIREAFDLQNQLLRYGSLKYTWIERAENHIADGACQKILDGM